MNVAGEGDESLEELEQKKTKSIKLRIMKTIKMTLAEMNLDSFHVCKS